MTFGGCILYLTTYQTLQNRKHHTKENILNVIKTLTQELNLIGIYYKMYNSIKIYLLGIKIGKSFISNEHYLIRNFTINKK